MADRRYDVVLLREAEDQLDRILLWWEENRTKAPDAVEEDLLEAKDQLAHAPESGSPDRKRPGRWRLLLPRIRYYLYYTVDHDAGRVSIEAIWHTSRLGP